MSDASLCQRFSFGARIQLKRSTRAKQRRPPNSPKEHFSPTHCLGSHWMLERRKRPQRLHQRRQQRHHWTWTQVLREHASRACLSHQRSKVMRAWGGHNINHRLCFLGSTWTWSDAELESPCRNFWSWIGGTGAQSRDAMGGKHGRHVVLRSFPRKVLENVGINKETLHSQCQWELRPHVRWVPSELNQADAPCSNQITNKQHWHKLVICVPKTFFETKWRKKIRTWSDAV